MNQSNRYLFTIRSLTGGGAERVVSVLASHMAADGYDVSVIAYGKTDCDYPFDKRVKLYFMPEAPDNVFGKLSRISSMKKLIDKIQPDVIIPFVGTVLFVSYLASRGRRIPIVRTIRNEPWIEKGNGIGALCRSYLNRRAAAIMVQNAEQLEFFPKKLHGKIFIVSNPVSDEVLAYKKSIYRDEVTRLVAVGRLTGQKNFRLLLSAFAKVRADFPHIILDIYGQGEEAETLKALIAKLGIKDCCHLAGRSRQIPKVLCDADLFVMTSDYEGMPNALMEAMAVGLPCISSDCRTGPRTLIDSGKTGFLFTTGNEVDLIAKMKYAISHPKELKEIGQRGRVEILENYTYDKICHSLLRLLESIQT